jgi:mannose/fructose/N-acetylgalactosamine-specific phosphotransferase system component IIC
LVLAACFGGLFGLVIGELLSGFRIGGLEFCWFGFGWTGGMDEPESLILAQSERWRNA